MSSLLERIKEFSKRLNTLDTMWDEYHSNVIRALELWHDLRREIQGKIAELQGLIEYCQERLKEVDIKAKIGLIEEREASTISKELQETIDKSSEMLSRLQEELSNANDRVEEHIRRVALQILLTNEEEFKERMAKLESLYREGKISEGLYKKIRSLILLVRTSHEEGA